MNENRALMLIGTGVNVEPVRDDTRPNAVAITEAAPRNFTGIEDAIVAFIEHVDARLAQPFEHDRVLAEWRELAVHRSGDRISVVIGERTVTGTWGGIDEHGRAIIRSGGEEIAISAGDLILA
jgi:biotin-(acetyl-CoA carboxylase) ligase